MLEAVWNYTRAHNIVQHVVSVVCARAFVVDAFFLLFNDQAYGHRSKRLFVFRNFSCFVSFGSHVQEYT